MSTAQSAHFPRFFRGCSVFVFVFSLVFSAARAEELVRYVSASGADSADGLTAETAFLTLDAAYANLAPLVSDDEPGVIRVLPGTVEIIGSEHTLSATLSYFAIDFAHPITIEGFGGTREECVLLSVGGTSAYHRHFDMTHPKAILRGVTLTGGSAASGKLGIGGRQGAGAVVMTCGVITNCFIHTNVGGGSGNTGGIKVEGNLNNPPYVADCVISNNVSNTTTDNAHALFILDGAANANYLCALVENCLIINNSGSFTAASVQVNNRAAVVRGCVITGAKCSNSYDGPAYHYSDGGGVRLKAGLVEGCIITNNLPQPGNGTGVGRGGGVFISGGLLLNNFIAHNTARINGGGVCATGGYIINNTIVDNTCANRAFGGGLSIAVSTTAIAVNNIIADNHTPIDPGSLFYNIYSDSVEKSGKLFDYNCTYPDGGVSAFSAASVGSHNIFARPSFSAAGDYRLSGASPCIDAALPTNAFVSVGILTALAQKQTPFNIAQFQSDFTGVPNARPLQGRVTSAGALPDIGAFEIANAHSGELVCSFAVSSSRAIFDIPEERRALGTDATNGLAAAQITLSAILGGAGTENHEADRTFSYEWTIENSRGEVTTFETTEPVVTNAFGFGLHDIFLTVRQTDGEATASFTETDAVYVAAPWAYVSENGANIPPYWRREDAARYISDAAAALCPAQELSGGRRHTVWVEPGTHKVRGKRVIIRENIDVRSEAGPAETILQAWGSDDPENEPAQESRAIIQVENPHALISGLTLTGGYYDNVASVILNSGTITNCIIEKNTNWGGDKNSLAGMLVKNGRVTDCVFRENTTTYKIRKGHALLMLGGTVENCVFTNNATQNPEGNPNNIFGIVVVDGTSAVLTNCVISKNTITQDYGLTFGIGLTLMQGKVINCKITDNYSTRTTETLAGAVFIGEADPYNTKITEATKSSASTLLRNCLIAGNSAPVNSVGTRGLYQYGGTVENCTIVNNIDGHLGGYGVYIRAASGFENNIIFNSGEDYFDATAEALFKTCCYPEATPEVGTGNIAADPKVRANGTLRFSSPCRNTGTFAAWQNGATDLAGNPRIHLNAVDIGAFEISGSGPTLMLLR